MGNMRHGLYGIHAGAVLVKELRDIAAEHQQDREALNRTLSAAAVMRQLREERRAFRLAAAKRPAAMLTKNISVPASGPLRLEIKSLDADKGVLQAYAATWHELPDRQNDVIQRGAFSASIRERPQVPLLWAHLNSETIGKCTRFIEDHHGLRFQAEICKDTHRGKEALSLLGGGYLNAFSIGFGIDDYANRRDGVRILKQISLYEVSVVPVPADVTATLI